MYPLNPAPRILLDSGPGTLPPGVLRAMAAPMVGYLDSQLRVYLRTARHLLKGT